MNNKTQQHKISADDLALDEMLIPARTIAAFLLKLRSPDTPTYQCYATADEFIVQLKQDLQDLEDQRTT